MGFDPATCRGTLDARSVSHRPITGGVVRVAHGDRGSDPQTMLIRRNLVGRDSRHDIVHYT